MRMFLPGCAFKLRTSSTTLLLIKVELRQAEAVVSVVETTYVGRLFMRSPNGSPAGMGSNAPPWICHVLRPRSSASLWLMASKKCAPMSSCQNGPVHPPWVKPPSVSSSAPPGACMTLSNDTNSETTMFRMIPSVLSRSNSPLCKRILVVASTEWHPCPRVRSLHQLSGLRLGLDLCQAWLLVDTKNVTRRVTK